MKVLDGGNLAWNDTRSTAVGGHEDGGVVSGTSEAVVGKLGAPNDCIASPSPSPWYSPRFKNASTGSRGSCGLLRGRIP